MSWEEDARRVAEIVGVPAGQRLPAVSRQTLRHYHTYLTAHLVFPFQAAIGLDHGIGHFMLFEVDSEAQASAPLRPKSPQTSSAASDQKNAPQPSSRQAE